MFLDIELTGQTRTHITQWDNPRCALHHQVVEPFLAMRQAAAEVDIDLWPYSSFRDFATQLKIWNDKYSGKRALHDEKGQALDYAILSETEIIQAILRWSALPGASRHHWGTEIDVIDRAATAPDYKAQLLLEECSKGGPYYTLHCWLDENLEKFGFYRPYRSYQGGVCPEPWHLSYFPLSTIALQELTIDVLAKTIRQTEILGKQWILEHLEKIYSDYVTNVARSPN